MDSARPAGAAGKAGEQRSMGAAGNQGRRKRARTAAHGCTKSTSSLRLGVTENMEITKSTSPCTPRGRRAGHACLWACEPC